MKSHVRSFVLFLVGWGAMSFLLFMFLADFFTAWSGRVVSIRDANPERPVVEVLIVDEDGRHFEKAWPRIAIDGLDLGIDPLALPPKPLPLGLPSTNKTRFSLTYTLEPIGGGVRTVATTGPRPFAIAVLFFFLGAGIRNMIVAGSPFSLLRPEHPLNHTAAPPAPPQAKQKPRSRGRKGPPPGRKRRGSGRRR